MLSPKFNVTLLNFSSERINTDQLIHQFGSLEALSITTEERLYAKSKNTTQRRSDLKEPEEPNHERLFTTIGEESKTSFLIKHCYDSQRYILSWHCSNL